MHIDHADLARSTGDGRCGVVGTVGTFCICAHMQSVHPHAIHTLCGWLRGLQSLIRYVFAGVCLLVGLGGMGGLRAMQLSINYAKNRMCRLRTARSSYGNTLHKGECAIEPA